MHQSVNQTSSGSGTLGPYSLALKGRENNMELAKAREKARLWNRSRELRNNVLNPIRSLSSSFYFDIVQFTISDS